LLPVADPAEGAAFTPELVLVRPELLSVVTGPAHAEETKRRTARKARKIGIFIDGTSGGYYTSIVRMPRGKRLGPKTGTAWALFKEL
jgi:hypothetical protein